MKLLADARVDPYSKDGEGRTPLSWAAENGHERVVELLLAEKGVEVDMKSVNGRTPLYRAAEKGHEKVVELLRKAGSEEETKWVDRSSF